MKKQEIISLTPQDHAVLGFDLDDESPSYQHLDLKAKKQGVSVGELLK